MIWFLLNTEKVKGKKELNLKCWKALQDNYWPCLCNVTDAHMPEAWNCMELHLFAPCHIVYVWFELWFHSPFFLTATVSWVNFGSGFCYKWMLITWCHCTLKALKVYESQKRWHPIAPSSVSMCCFYVTVSYQVKCLELIEFHFVLHNLGNPFTSMQKGVFFAFVILQRFPSVLPFLLIIIRM